MTKIKIIVYSPAHGPNLLDSVCTSDGKKYGIKYEDMSSNTLHKESISIKHKAIDPTNARTSNKNIVTILNALL